MKGILPPGPVGIEVHGIGFDEGRPIIVALVAVQYKNRPFLQECRFTRVNNSWFMGIHEGNEEEQEMLEKVWFSECDKRNLRSKDGCEEKD